MHDGHITISKRVARGGMAALAAILLISGAAWRGIAADGKTAAHAATASTPLQHAIAGSRDSYADVVDVVAPAVVTRTPDPSARCLNGCGRIPRRWPNSRPKNCPKKSSSGVWNWVGDTLALPSVRIVTTAGATTSTTSA